MNNKVLMALCIFSSVNLVNAMESAEAQLHADNAVKAFQTAMVANPEPKDMREILRLTTQAISPKDKEWCQDCINLYCRLQDDIVWGEFSRDEITSKSSHVMQRCVNPLMEAVKSYYSADTARKFNEDIARMAVFRASIEQFIDILQESEAQNKIVLVTLTPIMEPAADVQPQS
jgi:hypothetical protein